MEAVRKLCKYCGNIKALEDFYLDKKTKDRKSYYCKTCLRERASKWQRLNPERYAKRMKEWYAKNPGKAKANASKYYASGGWRERWYKKQYGLSVLDVDNMTALQSHRCAICETTSPGGKGKRFYVDHNHSTGKVRGMLCNKCNTAIGLLGDNPSTIIKASCYLMNGGFIDIKHGIDRAYTNTSKPNE